MSVQRPCLLDLLGACYWVLISPFNCGGSSLVDHIEPFSFFTVLGAYTAALVKMLIVLSLSSYPGGFPVHHTLPYLLFDRAV
jgi:hypothetical protein